MQTLSRKSNTETINYEIDKPTNETHQISKTILAEILQKFPIIIGSFGKLENQSMVKLITKKRTLDTVSLQITKEASL